MSGSEKNQFGVQVALKRAGCVVRSKQVFEVTSLCLYACTQPCLKAAESGNRISDANFLIVFSNNYGSILPSFLRYDDGTDNGLMSDRRTEIVNNCIFGP